MYNVYYLCTLTGGHGADREVSINMKHGIEAKSYEEVGHLGSIPTNNLYFNLN